MSFHPLKKALGTASKMPYVLSQMRLTHNHNMKMEINVKAKITLTIENLIAEVEGCEARIDQLEAENAKLTKALEKAAKSLYESTQSCPRDMFDWEHPATCDIECNTHSHVDDAWKCWLDWLMGAK